MLKAVIAEADLAELVSQFKAGWDAQDEMQRDDPNPKPGARTELGVISVLNTLGISVVGDPTPASTLTCQWCDLPAAGSARDSGGERHPSCGHGHEFMPFRDERGRR